MANQTASEEKLEWQVAVFCQNERSRIAACLASISTSIGSRRGLITVVINGSTDDSEAAAMTASANIDTPVQIFSIPQADKANAINSFLYNRQMRAEAVLYFFVDAYVTIDADALSAMAARLASCPAAVAASGIAGNGRTAARMARQAAEVGGILRGQFYCLTPDFIRRMVDGEIRLPIGLYRGDGLLGSMAAHDLNSLDLPWEN